MKFKIEKAESKKHEAAEKHYVVEKDLQKEIKRVEKELKTHESKSISQAHKK
jgi:transcriptional regulator NrdR family protein